MTIPTLKLEIIKQTFCLLFKVHTLCIIFNTGTWRTNSPEIELVI